MEVTYTKGRMKFYDSEEDVARVSKRDVEEGTIYRCLVMLICKHSRIKK